MMNSNCALFRVLHHFRSLCIIGGLLGLTTLFASLGWAEAPLPDQSSQRTQFLPLWKLLNSQEKQQFIAGYLQGLRDSEQVTDIAISYVRDNPEKAIEGLQKIRSLYHYGDLRPSELAHEVDQFFRDVANKDAPLAKAMSVARSNLK